MGGSELFRVLCAFLALSLSGCWYSSTHSTPGQRLVRSSENTYASDHALDRRTSPSDVQSRLANRTWLYQPVGASPQVYYTTAHGHVRLWYDDDPRLFTGEWKTSEEPTSSHHSREQVVALCFRYPGAPRPYGDWAKWQCRPAGRFLNEVKESLAGDVFGLSARVDAPFIMERSGRTTLTALRARFQQLVGR
jgi:hypothetical protein